MSQRTQRSYPETAFGGFTRCDGTIAFFLRVQAMLSPTQTLLELGCGRGSHQDDLVPFRRNLYIFKGKCQKVIGIDVDPSAATNPYIDEFRLIKDTAHWPIEDASIDLIVCDYVLEHVPNPNEFFAEVHRVLKPGGSLALRTVNARSYIVLASRLVPNRLHSKALKVAQENREAHDVFPTVYRCNTKGKVERTLRAHGLLPAVYRIEPEPAYFNFSRLAYRLAVFFHAHMPAWCSSTLLVFAKKPE